MGWVTRKLKVARFQEAWISLVALDPESARQVPKRSQGEREGGAWGEEGQGGVAKLGILKFLSLLPAHPF